MPKTNPIKSVALAGFVGGLNRDADPFQLQLDESPDALNVDFGLRGSVSKRAGFARYDSPTVASIFKRLVTWVRQGGATYRIAVNTSGDIYEDTGASLTDSAMNSGGTSEDQHHIAISSLNNLVYVTAINGGAHSFDGTTWTTVTQTAFDGTAARYPWAKFTIVKHDRVFAANVDDASTRYRSRVHFSNLLLAETWDAADYIDFDPDDGESITAMAEFGEDIVVMKNHSFQLLSGRTTESFSRWVIDEHIGTVSPRAVVPMGSILVFFDRDSGVWAYDGSGFSLLSEKINNYILDGINYSQAYKASAFVHREKMYLSVPWGTDAYPSRTFVWDQRTQAWSEYDIGIFDADKDGATIYGASPDNAQGVFTMQSTLNDDGAAIDSYVRTAWLAIEGPESKSRIRRLDLAFTALGNHDVDVIMYRNFETATPYITQAINTDPGGAVYGTAVYGTSTYGSGVDQVFLPTTGWGKRFRTVQFRFGVDGIGEDFQLNRGTLHVSSLDRVRGEA